MTAGIDYGMGQTNIDLNTGIRYGVISANDVGQAFYDAQLDYDYGDPTCPKCGQEVSADWDEDEDEESTQYDDRGCADFYCERCNHTLDSSDCYGEESIGWTFDEDGYALTGSTNDSDIFVLRSPFYTFASYCSPCAPGAVYLTSRCEDGAKGYCLGHDWFEGGVAPYPVYSVETGEEVKP